MALVQMASVEEALLALVHLHNHQMNGHYLRVSFSKNKIQAGGGAYGGNPSSSQAQVPQPMNNGSETVVDATSQ